MPITFNCPQCRKKYRVEDIYGGRQWRCPTCSADITIPRADEIPVEAVDEGSRRPAPRYQDEGPRGPAPRYADDDPRGPAPAPRRLYEDQPYEPEYRPSGGGGRELAPSWGTARAGLSVVNIGLIIYLVAFVIYVLTQVLIVTTARGGGPGANGLLAVATAVAIVFVLAALALLILWFVGVGMCCATPSESGGKGLAVGSLICSVLSIVLGLALVVFAIALAGSRRPGSQGDAILLLVIGGAAGIVAFVGFVLFLFYLRAVASYFGNSGLAVNVIVYLIVTILFILGVVAAILILGAVIFESLFRGNPNVGLARAALIFMIAIPVVEILLLAWLTYLVGATRTSIPTPRPYGRRGDYY
jgi:hypothetical protein